MDVYRKKYQLQSIVSTNRLLTDEMFQIKYEIFTIITMSTISRSLTFNSSETKNSHWIHVRADFFSLYVNL